MIEHPGIYLHEMQDELFHTTGVEISVSSICRFLNKSGFSRQKMVYTAAQQDKQLRAQFASYVSIYKSDMLVFIDETGSDRRDTLRKKGYSLRNKPPKAQNLFHSNREHVSALACMSKNGILGCEVVHGGVDGDQFYDFVERSVLPNISR